jgi:hypothetical protein
VPLRLSEATVSRVDRLLKTTRDRHGAAVARTTRTVLSGLFGLAVRHDALDGNPVRDAAPIRGSSKAARALELAEVWASGPSSLPTNVPSTSTWSTSST